MNSSSKLKIWLKDGSLLKDWTLTQTDLKVGGLSFDFDTFQKLDDSYLYLTDGSKVYRDRVKGTIDVHSPAITDPLRLALEQIEEMLRA